MNPIEYREPYLNLRLFDVLPNVQSTATSDLSNEMKTFYSKDLIKSAKANLIYDSAAQKVNIPKGGGNKVELRKFSSLPKATSSLTDGVTPDGNSLQVTKVDATVLQYGSYVTVSDRLVTEAIDPVILNANQLLADQAGRTADTITREVIVGGTNKLIVPAVASNGTVTATLLRSGIGATNLLRVKDIVDAVTRLKRMNAPKINGYYIGFIHPDLVGDLQNSTGWLDVHKYDASEQIFAGELGRIGGVKFLESSEAKIIAPAVISNGLSRLTVAVGALAEATTVYIDEELTPAASVSIPVYLDGVENTITKIEADATYGVKLTVSALPTGGVADGDMLCGRGAGTLGHAVYLTMICGANAYGTTTIDGEGLEFIFHPIGSGGSTDPLNQRATIGWKLSKVAERLVEENMVRIESTCAEYGLTAASN